MTNKDNYPSREEMLAFIESVLHYAHHSQAMVSTFMRSLSNAHIKAVMAHYDACLEFINIYDRDLLGM